MQKIPIDILRSWWKEKGIWGEWRENLKTGYRPDEPYFEFGLIPESNPQRGDFRIVIDHEVHVHLCPANIKFRGEYVIQPSNVSAFEDEVTTGYLGHKLLVAPEVYEGFLVDAAQIYNEYKDEEIGCFWSIPNKWFGDLMLIEFLMEHVVLTEDYINRPRARQDWYWP